MNSYSPDSDACILRGEKLAAQLKAFANSGGADEGESARTYEIAKRAFPILLWQYNRREIVQTAEAFICCASLLQFGIATAALQRFDVPMTLRQLLLPVLRPDAHDVSVKWWDEVAMKSWVEPFFFMLSREGRFKDATHVEATP